MSWSWQPITQNELELLIEQTLAEMDHELRERFLAIQVPMYLVKCRRNFMIGKGEEEEVFVVAQDKCRAIVFDDVEEEFVVAELSQKNDEIIGHWISYGDLRICIERLEH